MLEGKNSCTDLKIPLLKLDYITFTIKTDWYNKGQKTSLI